MPSIHPELERVNTMRSHHQILSGHSYLGQGGTGYRTAEQEQFARLSPRGDSVNATYEALYIFQNLNFGPLTNYGFLIMISPVSAELTHERNKFFFYGDDAMGNELAENREVNAELLRTINRQDIGICESVQTGRKSPAFNV